MAQELELKTVVPEPATLRTRLLAAGATLIFRGVMEDRRYDRDGALLARDEVLRIRRFIEAGGASEAELTWKGRTRRSADGYKLREELSCRIAVGAEAVGSIIEALGYRVSQAIDRYVELYRLAEAVLRVEWYPRMDVLLEVEGSPAAIEAAVDATGLPRDSFTAEMLTDFVQRYDARGGKSAVLAVADLAGEPPAWERV
jgi:adenylate cyclase class IV